MKLKNKLAIKTPNGQEESDGLNMIASLDILKEEYEKILCYPRCEAGELEKRLNELRSLGVKALCLKGKKKIENTPILGKGCVGIVVAAYTESGEVALKIRRTDAEPSRIAHEAKMLSIANSIDVGPRILGFSENFIMLDLIDGNFLSEWIENLEEKSDSESRLRLVLKDILEQCRRLDMIGLDHGELSQASKHIIVNKEDKAYIIDFETASITRRSSNVTSICHYLFLRGKTAEKINTKIGKIKQDEIIAALKDYKRNPTTENFKVILKACHLENAEYSF